MTGFSKIAFVAARGDAAGAARDRLAARYGDAKPSEAELIVALGGDGFMLQTLHKYMTRNVPIYGMNQGTVGRSEEPTSEHQSLMRISLAVFCLKKKKQQTRPSRM